MMIAAFLYAMSLAALPIGIVWGWMRWARRRQPSTPSSFLSLTSFTLASLSAVIAVWSLLYSHLIGGFPFYDPLLMRIYAWGGMLSFGGVVLAVAACWRPSVLRWHALLCSVGMLFFWIISASAE